MPRKESDAEAHAACGADAATPAPWVASSVRVGSVDGAMGQLSINAPYLSWTPTPAGASDEPAQQVELRNVLYAEIDDDDEVRFEPQPPALRCDRSEIRTPGAR